MNTYKPEFFTPKSIEHAKNLILTPEDSTIENRWETESVWTLEMIKMVSSIDKDSVVLDWGCGIGRISKLLIETFDCKVVGVDLESKMLDYAVEYVNSNNFSTLSYENLFKTMPRNHFTHAISIWVFQHSDKLQIEVPLIYESMKNESELFVIDMMKKCIPGDTGFYTDDVNSRDILSKFYNPIVLGKIPKKFTTKKIQDMSWWALLERIEK
jgi:ubiquinone/menaquinone biosynthesis C-methylase UbiE